MNKKHSYGIVGDGRMANHFCHYLSVSGVSFVRWSRKTGGNSDPSVLFQGCDFVLLLISDGAILPFVEKFPNLRKFKLIHFSGSLVLNGIPSYHPLMTFSHELYSLAEYQAIPFVSERGELSFSEIFPDLPNASFAINPEDKPLYHALCVLSGNFTVMLWQKAFSDFEQKLGLKADLLKPYMHRICKNLEKDWKNCLTGPLARGDEITIKKNLESLNGDVYQKVYQAFRDTLKLRRNGERS